METVATLHVGSLSVPINLRATNGQITIIRPDGSVQAFEGRPRLTWRDWWHNWFQLSFARSKPLRCTFDCVSIETNPGGERLVIAPGSPYDELLTIEIRGNEASVIAEWNKGKLQWLRGKTVRYTADEAGFSVMEAETLALIFTVRWTDVRAIRTYKRDLLIYDMICLGFQLIDKSWIELWEESKGFIEVGERMREVFPSIPEKWHNDVMMPPFATNDMLLYRRDDRSGEWTG